MKKQNEWKRLPDSELELMLIIWQADKAITRSEIEKQLKGKTLTPTTINSFLSRLEEKGFLQSERIGKTNFYTPLVKREDYLSHESKTILEKMYGNSVKNFVAALYDGKSLKQEQIEELKEFINQL